MCRWSVAVSTDKSVPLFHCLSAPRCRVGGTRATAVSPCPAPLQSLVNTAGVGSRLQLRSLQPATRFTIPPLIGRISRCGRTSAATLYICGLQLPGTAGNHRPAGGERAGVNCSVFILLGWQSLTEVQRHKPRARALYLSIPPPDYSS